MTDKSSLLRGFNNHFFDFFNDLITVLPENKEIVYAKTSFETVKRANPTAIIKTWYKHIFLPYKHVIDNGNLTFFIDKDYVEDLSIVMNSREIINMIDNIRKPIREMELVNKNHALKYIQNLCKLSELYNDCTN